MTRHHKKCDKCGHIGSVGADVCPYYVNSKEGIEWMCRSCADAERAKKSQKDVAPVG